MKNNNSKTKIFFFALILFGLFGWAQSSQAVTNVYYSVGQNATDHSSGGNVSITSGVATFTVPQTATNLGVGDRLTANSNVYYLASKTSATVWNVVTKLGAVPADQTSTAVTSIAHEYTTLSAAEAGASDANHINNTSLVAADVILNIPCYYDSAADTTAVTITDWTTGANNYIKIYTPNNTATEVNTSQRHAGKWDTGKYILSSTSGSVLLTYEEYTRIDGLQIHRNNNDLYAAAVNFGNVPDSVNIDLRLSNSILMGSGTNGSDVRLINGYPRNVTIWNNILYDNISTSGWTVFVNAGSNYLYNNTFHNCTSGIKADTANATIAKNNLFKSVTTAANGTFAAGSGYNATNNAAIGYTVTGGATLDRVDQTFTFIDEAGDNFHLASTDAGAKDYGVNPLLGSKIGDWNLNEDPAIHNTAIIDSSGAGNNGTLTTNDGSTDKSVTGQVGEAVKFDGSDDVVKTGAVTLTSNYTLSFWFKNDSVPGSATYSQPFTWNSPSPATGVNFSWNHVSADNRQAWGIFDTGWKALKYTTSLQADTWYHLTLTYNGTTARAYLNGKQEVQLASGTPTDTGTEVFAFGAGGGGAASFDDGVMDEVKVFTRALAPLEVEALYNNSVASFSNDIDGETRTGSWDIGADEAYGSSYNVYYSVSGGGSTANLMTSSPTISISSGVATFSTAQTGNIGVGDAIIYDNTNTAYISGKTSSTVWSVVSATGKKPDNVSGLSVNSIKRTYPTLSAAEAGADDAAMLNTANLVTGNYILNLPCYYDSAADTTAVTVDGWTTGANNYIKIYTPNNTATEANQSQRHSGKWSTSHYRLAPATGDALTISDENVRAEGLQFNSADDDGVYVNGATGASNIQISQTVIKGNSTAGKKGINMASTGASSSAKIWNNIIYDYSGAGAAAAYWNDADWTIYAYNNTVQNSAIGLERGNDTAHYAKNNLIKATDAFSGTFTDNDANNDYNSISENTNDVAIGSHGRYNQIFIFMDEAVYDFHLAATDPGAKGYGVDLSTDANLAFSNDIDSDGRPSAGLGVWDIGADESSGDDFRARGSVKFRGNVKIK